MRNFIYLLILSSSSLHAGEILKWVDENGNVYYGDAAPLSVETEEISIISGPSNPGKALPRLSSSESQASSGNTGTGTGNNRNNNDPTEDQAKIACKYAKEDLAVISNSSRIKLKSADGSERYMSEAEIATRKENAEKDITRFCQ